MAKIRVTVKWVFEEVKRYWKTLDYKRKMRSCESPVGALYITAMLLENMRKCVYPNSVAQFFDCIPTSLEEYLLHKDGGDQGVREKSGVSRKL